MNTGWAVYMGPEDVEVYKQMRPVTECEDYTVDFKQHHASEKTAECALAHTTHTHTEKR